MSLNFGKYCIFTPKIPLFFAGIIVILGSLAAVAISKESAPYIEYGIVTVSTVYPGVGAEDVDLSVTQKLENKIKLISGIDTMNSTSRDGFSSIVLKLETDAVVSEIVSDVRSAVDEAKGDLPSDLDNDPRVSEIDSSGDRPFLKIALTAPKSNFSDYELSAVAEKLQKKLEKISGVANVKVENKVDTEIKILLNKNKLESLHLSYSQVLSAIQSSEKNTPLGNFSLNKKDYSLRFQGESSEISDLGNIIIGKIGEGTSAHAVVLSDIATIKVEAIKDAPITRFYSLENKNLKKIPENSIILKVARSGGGDIFSTEKKTLEALNQFLKHDKYSEISATPFSKATVQMTKDYWNLFTSFVFSVSVVLLSIFFFIGVREGIIAAAVIPLSFLGTIFILFFLGRTMNFMTNFGMILALGILVDTAIVIVEGASHFIKKGFSPQEAAFKSFIEFRAPLFAGMLTTLIVFLPLFFLPGVVGKFLSFIPVTVTIVLIVALLVSLFIIPALAGVVLKPEISENRKNNFFSNICTREKINTKIDSIIDWYVGILKKILTNKFLKYGIFIATFVMLFLSALLPSKFEMFPTEDSDRIAITLKLPEGTDSSLVVKEISQVEDFLKTLPETTIVHTAVEGNIASVLHELSPFKERESLNQRTSHQLETLIQEKFSTSFSEDISFQVQREKKGPPSVFPVGFRVKISDVSQIESGKRVAYDLTELLKKVEGTQGVTHSITEIPGEYRFILDREKAFLRGVDPSQIPFSIRGAVYGNVVSTFRKGDTDLDIRLQLDPKYLKNIDDVLAVEVKDGVPLSSVVKVVEKSALSSVTRNEGDLVFTVSSFLTKDGNAQEITDTVMKKIQAGEINLPEGITIDDASENAENSDLMKAMLVALVMAILMIFLVLVVQFEAFSPPLLILQTVIFAFIGVFIGLYITGTDKSMSFMLGVISLTGIVVNDAIILVDKIRSNVFSGNFATKLESVLDAGKTRFIPVVLTTITTSAGIFPLIFIDSFWAGLAYTIIFGLSISSLLTLFLIPIGYLLFEKNPEISET